MNVQAPLPDRAVAQAVRRDVRSGAALKVAVDEGATLARTSPGRLAVAVEAGFDFGSAEYRDLVRRADVTAFQSGDWLSRLVRDLVPAAGRPIPLVIRDVESRRPVLVLPLLKRRWRRLDVIEMIDCRVTDYNLPVLDSAEAGRLAADRTLPRRIERCLKPYDLLSLSKVSRHGELIARLFPRARRAPMRMSAYGAPLSGTWEEWRARSISPRVRRYLDKKRRSLSRHGTVTFQLETDRAVITTALEALRRFRSLRFKAIGAEDIMADDAVYRFYLEAAIAGAGTGAARTYVLHVDGAPAGIVSGIVHAGVFHHLLLAYDVERHARRSVGLLASEDAMHAVLGSGLGTYDFTIGDHPFKVQLGATASPLSEWHQAGSWRGRMALALHVAQREVKRWLKPVMRPAAHPPYSPLSGA